MRLTRLTGGLLPLALLAFAAVAVTEFPRLPARVPVHFDASGFADRWAAPRQFIGLSVTTVLLLGGLLLFARHFARTEEVGPGHVYTRHPEQRQRVVAAVDLVGGSLLLLLTWVVHLCAQAAVEPEPRVARIALTAPLVGVLLAAAAAAVWTRRT